MLNLLTMKKCLKKILISFAFIFTFLFAQKDNSVAADNLSEKVDSNIFIEEKPAEEKENNVEISDDADNKKSDKKKTEKKNKKKSSEKNAEEKKEDSEKDIPDEVESDSEEKILPEKVFELIELYGNRPEVEYWRNIYLTERWQKVLRGILENAVEYRVYVRKCVQEKNVPLELEYLPVVESGYKTSVRSKSGAVGMWQFMSNSVRPFLKLNEYVDERYDPWLSTQAGIAKLQDNYKIFNDWLIAIAAYNCGNGKMAKTIRHAGTKDYWQLVEKKALPKQTAEFIPKLIAIADLAVNYEKYGIDLPRHDKEFEELVSERDAVFDYVPVKKPYLIQAIAKECSLTEKELKHFNPALTKGFTPPAATYELRLPAGKKEEVEAALAKVKPIEFPFKYTVVKGDSLWSISRKFGVTVQALCDTNGIKENAILRIGKVLYIPSVKK